MPTIVKSFVFNPVSENTYVLSDAATKEAIVIDPGCYTTNERKMLSKYIADNTLIVKRLLNTHCHLDHVFGNDFVSETYGVALECHRAELPVLARASQAGEMYGMPFPQPKDPSVFIEDGDEISVGSIKLTAILAPGHSPGSLGFYSAADGFIVGGDVLFFRSIGRTDLPLGNHSQLINSIKTRFLTLPDETKVFNGHGQVTTIGFEKYNNPFLF